VDASQAQPACVGSWGAVMLIYFLIALCFVQLIAIAVLVLSVTASSEVIDDMRQALRQANGDR
jgi:hypothetical protein